MIFSPVDFLPSFIRLLTNLATTRSWNLGSGRIFRFTTTRRRGIETVPYLARALGAVLGPTLLTALNADRVERPANDVVTHAREVLHAAPADEHHRVLLEVVADARNVARHLEPVGEADAGHLAEGRVRLLGGRGVDASADAALLRRLHERRRLLLRLELLAPLAHKLADGRHALRGLSLNKNAPRGTEGGWKLHPSERWGANYTVVPRPVKRFRLLGDGGGTERAEPSRSGVGNTSPLSEKRIRASPAAVARRWGAPPQRAPPAAPSAPPLPRRASARPGAGCRRTPSA